VVGSLDGSDRSPLQLDSGSIWWSRLGLYGGDWSWSREGDLYVGGQSVDWGGSVLIRLVFGGWKIIVGLVGFIGVMVGSVRVNQIFVGVGSIVGGVKRGGGRGVGWGTLVVRSYGDSHAMMFVVGATRLLGSKKDYAVPLRELVARPELLNRWVGAIIRLVEEMRKVVLLVRVEFGLDCP